MATAEPTHSPWRLEVRRVIAGVLAGLPADTPLALVRKALRDVYPFGRRENHPYRCWCVEVRRALGARPQKPPHLDGPGEVYFVLSEYGVLRVECGWCRRTVRDGCMMCHEYVRQLRGVFASREWPGWREGLVKDRDGTLPYLADWLEERGHTLLAGWCREQGGACDGSGQPGSPGSP
jgi:hypothetical protein